MQTVIFDLDGTLVDSAPDIRASVNKMLAEEGLPDLNLPTVISFVGNGLPTLVRRVMAHFSIEDSQFSRLNARVLAIYNASTYEHTVMYYGVREVLSILHAKGVRLGVCTNKPEEPARHVLDALDLTQYFDVVVGGDTFEKRKPDPLPLLKVIGETSLSDVLYVGDSEVDAETARRAGVTFALFTEGYRKSPVEDMPHDMRFSEWREFLSVVEAKKVE
ncbi:phosphoglycolate phosphatase [Shimia sagamensis]|uniref:phosphoglycolate phosphatase n=1 Tax=Shimia sagamensis TaxID=1566352 RepID=A0ABY1NM00_9RHOB|nr:phosphoglycolate phosphatase [Shimia sagamensis]SMP13092.1 phosphoglycolate phosphatase [Shimia sagamensis]